MPVMAPINLLIFAALLVLLVSLAQSGVGLSRRVLLGLVLGSVFGFYLQFGFGNIRGLWGDFRRLSSWLRQRVITLIRVVMSVIREKDW